jgi:2,5-dichlorohydroquinone reductive dechlorinase
MAIVGDELDKRADEAREALRRSGARVGDENRTSRFELFGAPNSICSQKVRSVLAFHGFAYRSHDLNLFEGQTYTPEYIRLRMIGCRELGGPLVSQHDGDTSTAAGGCDPAVVPTLLDWQTRKVIVDSKRICLHLDEQLPDSMRLRPEAIALDVDAELTIVDGLPNYQLLMGRQAASSTAHSETEAAAAAFSRRKVAWCDESLARHPNDADLQDAYAAKRSKEASAVAALFTPEAMHAAQGRVDEELQTLETKFASRGAPWLLGSSPTMADLFWGIELIRLKDLGADRMRQSGRLPSVAVFLDRIEEIPAIRQAIIDWPGALLSSR